MITGDRIRHAREFSGFTQGELATRVLVGQPEISSAEIGRSRPSPDLVRRIADETGFPVAFFEQPDALDFPLGSLLFRARASLASRDRSRVHRCAQTVFELVERLGQHANQPTLRLPASEGDPAAAAALVRASLSLSPDKPITHLINALERSGLVVLFLPIQLERVDAFSVWAGMESLRPVIAVPGIKSADRLRFSIAHELGHLVMHRAPRKPLVELESEANQFAAEFLLPAQAMREEITVPVTLMSLPLLKKRWGVSIQALVRRAYDLAMITERQYRYLFQQIAARGWKKQEPVQFDIPLERPRLLRKLVEVLYGIPINYSRLAADTNLTPHFLKEVVELHSAGPRTEITQTDPQPRGQVVSIFAVRPRGRPRRRSSGKGS